MRCDEARSLLHDKPGPLQRLILWLHLLRCPACGAEAADIRAISAALNRLPRHLPPSGLLSTVLASASLPNAERNALRRRITMTRLVYALTFLIAIGLLLGGLLFRSAPPDGAALLISAAQAMEEVDAIHVQGYSITFIIRPWGAVGAKGSYDHWLSPEGIRRQWFDQDGDLEWSSYTNVETGLHWKYYPPYRLVWTVPIGVEEARESAARSAKRYLDGQVMIRENVEQMGFKVSAARRERRDGTEVYVVTVDKEGESREYDIEAATGRLLALRDYGAPESGRPPLGETYFEYGVALPDGALKFEVPEGWTVKEGVREENGALVPAAAPGEEIARDDSRLLAAEAQLARAHDVRLQAEAGAASWSDVEQAYLAVADPKGALVYTEPWETASQLLGRIYVRQGRYQEALDILSAPDAVRGWQGLVRAWCFDALGKRSEAVRIYRKLERGQGSLAQWGALGLKQSASPRELEIEPEPGDMLLAPAPGWRASAHRSPSPFRPEAAIDGDRAVRWAANASEDGPGQEPGDWFELDFGEPTEISRIVLDHQGSIGPYISDWPRGIKARFTTDGRTWRSAQVAPAGPMQPAAVTFDRPQAVRAICFELTETHSPEWWTIYEVLVFAPTN